ncbi:YkgJ family cysteine cluster protein [Clostridium cuniculi]|uniref:YkgJ family cysteine cluster protein n=1 Tax=Clostridium cuniculi TaxID=2548455 RepID=UPI0010556F21|nr:YkgJ family cysteine cluster protein [Clostridium cuniculi]
MTNIKFQCDKCGVCCTRLNMNSIYSDLHDGSGVCRYFSKESRLCLIYDNRPDKCDVIKMYKLFKDKLSLKEYIEINKIMCDKLRRL